VQNASIGSLFKGQEETNAATAVAHETPSERMGRKTDPTHKSAYYGTFKTNMTVKPSWDEISIPSSNSPAPTRQKT
jgi:hypothetical protein